MNDGTAVRVRTARVEEASILAHMQKETHRSAFLPVLGERFLRRLFRAQIEDPDAVVLVAERDGQVIGYVTGVLSSSAFRRRFIRRHAIPAALAMAPRLVRPGVVRRVFETARYPEKAPDLPEPEITNVALAPRARARGVADLLVEMAIAALAEMGVDEIKAFVAADNGPSNRLATRMGFERRGEIVLHDGRPTNTYVIRCSAPSSARSSRSRRTIH